MKRTQSIPMNLGRAISLFAVGASLALGCVMPAEDVVEGEAEDLGDVVEDEAEDLGEAELAVQGDVDNDTIPDDQDCANNNPHFAVDNPDFDGNNEPWKTLACNYHVGEIMIGVSYKDKTGSNTDRMDGATPICWNRCNPAGGQRMPNPDIDSTSRPFINRGCLWGEVLVGVRYMGSGFTDGVTAMCAPATGGTPVAVSNSDFTSPGTGFLTDILCPAGSSAVGLRYKDTYSGWGDPDAADGVTMLCHAGY